MLKLKGGCCPMVNPQWGRHTSERGFMLNHEQELGRQFESQAHGKICAAAFQEQEVHSICKPGHPEKETWSV